MTEELDETEKLLSNKVVKEGESVFSFECDNCHDPKRIPFKYTLRHKIVEYHPEEEPSTTIAN